MNETATWNLARFLAGASDADLTLIRQTWPDCPADGPETIPDVWEWLARHPRLAAQVLEMDISQSPAGLSAARFVVPPLSFFLALDWDKAQKAGIVCARCRLTKPKYSVDDVWLWVVDQCPFCGKTHVHGGGPGNGDPMKYLGTRSADCGRGTYWLIPATEERRK